MFNWLYSKNAYDNKQSVLNNSRKTLIHNEIQVRYRDYIPRKEWLKNLCNYFFTKANLKKITNFFPIISLTGNGLSINGFILDLNKISPEIIRLLQIMIQLYFISGTEGIQFMDDKRQATYLISLYPEDEVCINSNQPENTYSLIMKLCNATASVPKLLGGEEIARVFVCNSNIFSVSEIFYREGEIINKAFEICVIKQMELSTGNKADYSFVLNDTTKHFLQAMIGIVLAMLACLAVHACLTAYRERVAKNPKNADAAPFLPESRPTRYGAIAADPVNNFQSIQIQDPEEQQERKIRCSMQ